MLADDVEVTRRVLAHIDAGTTDEGDGWREPVANYLDPDRFADEMRLLRASPSVFAPSAALAGTGDHVERVVFGTPLLAVRGHDGVARVFRNTCRHRGAALVEGTGCSRALVCPYHGWTYRLDGSLAHVPHADGFPDLDMGSRGLVEVASREAGGLIVIDGVDPAETGASAVAADLADGEAWAAKLLPAGRFVAAPSNTQALNWKVLVEQFLEGYHIRSTHRETFFPLQYDNLNVVEAFGPHSRVVFPFRNIERLRDRPESAWVIDHRVTFVYHLFPTAIVATFPDVVLVLTLDPVDVDHTTQTTFVLARVQPTSVGESSGHERRGGDDLVFRGAVEDNAMSTAVQRGLRSGANAFVEFGRHESAIGHFHRTLDGRLAARPGRQGG